MRERLIFGISPGFPELSRCQGQVTHVLLTRSPLGTTRCCHRMGLARLACVKHAASVRPEPGSNSPSEIVEIPRRTADGGCGEDFALVRETRCPRGHRGSPSSPRRARRGWTAPGVNLVPQCWLIRSPDVPSTVAWDSAHRAGARCACPVDGVEALAFHTLLSFQGASWIALGDSPGGSPSQVPSPERRQPYSGPSRFVNRATYPLVPPGTPAVPLVRTRSLGA